MNSNTNFTEWTREEKEKFAQKRMAEMELMNAKLKRRHAEVEFDRMAAEKQNSAITNVPKTVKDPKQEVKLRIVTYSAEREWDRGKPDMDNWESPQHSAPNYSSKAAYNKRDVEHSPRPLFNSKTENSNAWQRDASGGQKRTPLDRKDTKDSFQRNKNFDSFRYGPKSESRMRSRKEFRSKQFDNHHSSSHHYKSPEKRTGFGHRSNESYRKPHAYSEDKVKKSDFNRFNTKKKLSSGAHSQSSSRSNSDHADNVESMKISTVRVESLWENDKVSEDRNKQNRTENWVKSVSGRPYKWENSSDEDKKRVHSKYVPGDIKSAECGTAHNLVKHERAERGASILTSERVKGIKSKRSPQSITSSKNEHASKQRRFDRGVREEDASKYPKFQQQSNMKSEDDSWNNSSVGNKNIRNERSLKKSNFVKSKTLNETCDDGWGDAKHDNSRKKSDDDDIWGNVEQSGIKWNLSDEDTSLKKHQNEFSGRKKCLNTWNENEMPYKTVDKRRTTKNQKSYKGYNNRDHGYQKQGVYSDNNDYEDPEHLWDKFKQESVNVEAKDSHQKQGIYGDNDYEDPEHLWDKFKEDAANVENKDSYKSQDDVQKSDDNLWNKIKQDSYHADSSKTKIPESTGAYDIRYDVNDPGYLAEKLKANCKISDEMETVEDKTIRSSDDSWITQEGTHSDDECDNAEKNKDSTPR